MQMHLSPRNLRLSGAIHAYIAEVGDKLARQLRKRKTRLVDKRRKSSPKESRR